VEIAASQLNPMAMTEKGFHSTSFSEFYPESQLAHAIRNMAVQSSARAFVAIIARKARSKVRLQNSALRADATGI
jgi:hypothetical protein